MGGDARGAAHAGHWRADWQPGRGEHRRVSARVGRWRALLPLLLLQVRRGVYVCVRVRATARHGTL